jgi:small subunit ribosomal protein S20
LRLVEEAIAAGDAKKASAALAAAEPKLMRAAQKGVIHPNTASRKVARLAKRVRKLAG